MLAVKTVRTEFSQISYLSSLGDATVIACGQEHGNWRLIRYDLHSGREVNRATLEHPPDGITTVLLDGIRCLAIAYP